MKLRLTASIFLFALTPLAFARPIPIESATIAPGKFYVGVFGGVGSSNDFDISQFGTAFYFESVGGPLAVNAFGQTNSQNGAFFGVQLGYQAQEIPLYSSRWALGPAAELEGYFMNKRSFDGDLINDSVRLPEHDFLVTYPMKRTVFLANGVLNFNNACFPAHPYIGFGIGNAIVRISDAIASQVSPPEVGVNHYNESSSDTTSVFAGQIKLGLSYDIYKCISLFAEYRWLYLATTHFLFGSTVYPSLGHPETSSWQVKLNDQRYNLGNIGVRFTW